MRAARRRTADRAGVGDRARRRRGAHAAALRALEAIGDPRALTPALDILADAAAEPAVGAAAAGVARVFLRGRTGRRAVDRLTAVALDRGRPDAAARWRRSGRCGSWTRRRSTRPGVARRGSERSDPRRSRDEADGQAQRRPIRLATVTRRGGAGTAGRTGRCVALRRALGGGRRRSRCRCCSASSSAFASGRRAEPAARRANGRWRARPPTSRWRSRGSRLALYDLRETLEAATAPLPVEFLAALTMVGDASCLEPIAGAYANDAKQRDWWRDHLADAFRAIVAREKLTRRHAAIKKIEKRWPQSCVWTNLWPTRQPVA